MGAAAAAVDISSTSVFSLFAPFPEEALFSSFFETFEGSVETESFLVAAALLTSMTLAKCVSFSRGKDFGGGDAAADDDDDEDVETVSGSGCSALEINPEIP